MTYSSPDYQIAHAREFSAELRRLGFRKDYESVGGGCRTRIYVKTLEDGKRQVEVQLDSFHKHRASHMYAGRGTTPPSDFTSLEGMRQAIEHESTRTDCLAHPRASQTPPVGPVNRLFA